MSHLTRMSIFATAMSAFLIFMVSSHAYSRASGTEVILEMQPRDPRDFFLGYYSAIGTELSRMDIALLEGDHDFSAGDHIYVVLQEGDEGLWHPVSAHNRAPADPVFIHGMVFSSIEQNTDWQSVTDPGTGDTRNQQVDVFHLWVSSRFNIENYYSNEESARELDQLVRPGENTNSPPRIILSISDNGNAIIKGIEVDGVRHINSLW